MEKFNKTNVSQICTIRNYINAINSRYTYKNKATFLGFTIRKEGFYWHDSTYHTKETIERDGSFVVKEKKVYYRPHVEIRLCNNTVLTEYFDTEDELKAFMDQPEFSTITWINHTL